MDVYSWETSWKNVWKLNFKIILYYEIKTFVDPFKNIGGLSFVLGSTRGRRSCHHLKEWGTSFRKSQAAWDAEKWTWPPRPWWWLRRWHSGWARSREQVKTRGWRVACGRKEDFRGSLGETGGNESWGEDRKGARELGEGDHRQSCCRWVWGEFLTYFDSYTSHLFPILVGSMWLFNLG